MEIYTWVKETPLEKSAQQCLLLCGYVANLQKTNDATIFLIFELDWLYCNYTEWVTNTMLFFRLTFCIPWIKITSTLSGTCDIKCHFMHFAQSYFSLIVCLSLPEVYDLAVGNLLTCCCIYCMFHSLLRTHHCVVYV